MNFIRFFPSKTNKAKINAVSALAIATISLASCKGELTSDIEDHTDDKAARLVSAAVVSEGAKLFKLKCATCHSVERGKASVVGPTLFDLIDRPAGALKGFAYSNAMKTYGDKWTKENLDNFLKQPSAWVPRNRMAFAGLSNDNQRKLIIEYIDQFK